MIQWKHLKKTTRHHIEEYSGTFTKLHSTMSQNRVVPFTKLDGTTSLNTMVPFTNLHGTSSQNTIITVFPADSFLHVLWLKSYKELLSLACVLHALPISPLCHLLVIRTFHYEPLPYSHMTHTISRT